jgi:hypothetical protein
LAWVIIQVFHFSKQFEDEHDAHVFIGTWYSCFFGVPCVMMFCRWMELHSAIADTKPATQMHPESTNKCSSIHWQTSYTEGTPTTKLHQIPMEKYALCSSSTSERGKSFNYYPC